MYENYPFVSIILGYVCVEAVTTIEVVVDIHRKLADIHPGAFEFAFLEALFTFSSYLHSVEKKKETSTYFGMIFSRGIVLNE